MHNKSSFFSITDALCIYTMPVLFGWLTGGCARLMKFLNNSRCPNALTPSFKLLPNLHFIYP